MILKSMKILNFRPYKDPEPIHFANGEKNVTIIQGRNDAGKTSFINAITWCLYDHEPFRDGGVENRCNKLAIKEANIGDTILVKVEIRMEDNFGKNVDVIREQSFKKTGDFTVSDESISKLTIKIEEDGSNTPIKNPEQYIRNNMPGSLQEYFMFTGERLTQFFNKDHNFVKEGVHTLYQLDLLANLINQADKWEHYYYYKYRSINPELAEKKEELSNLETQQKDDKSNISKNLKEIEKLTLKVKNYQEELGGSGASYHDLTSKINQKEKERSKKEDELSLEKENYSSLLFKNFSKILSYNLLKNMAFWKNFEEEINDEDDVITFTSVELKKLLRQNSCVCGTELKEGSEPFKKIQDLIIFLENNVTDSSLSIEERIQKVTDLSENLLARYPTDFEIEIRKSKQRMNELKLNIELLQNEIEGYEIRKQDLKIPKILDLEGKIKNNESLIDNYRNENIILYKNLDEYPEKIEKLKEIISAEEKKDSERNEFSKRMDFCKSIKLISKDLYEELTVNIYETLSDIVTEEYTTIHWKNDYKRIIVNQDFDVFVEKIDGDTVLATDPSTGSRNVLALTFMAALNSLSGFTLPQIIDTPIASLDIEMRADVAKYLPNYMEDKQMIL